MKCAIVNAAFAVGNVACALTGSPLAALNWFSGGLCAGIAAMSAMGWYFSEDSSCP